MKLSKKYKRTIKTNLIKILLATALLLVIVAVQAVFSDKVTLLFSNARQTDIALGETDTSLTSENKVATPKIVGGYNYFISLTADGKVYGWGENSYGQLATGDTKNQTKPVYMGIDNVIDIAAGTYFNVILKADGTVWTIGDNANGQCRKWNTREQQ